MRFEKTLPAIATACAVVASLAVGAPPAAAAPPDYPLTGAIESVDVSVAPDGTFAYVADHDQQVLRVDTATNAVTDDLQYMSGRWVEAVAVSPDNTYVYAAHYVSPAMNGVVRRIDAATNTFVGSDIAVGGTPSDVVFAPSGDFALVVNGGDGTVSRIATASNTVTATIALGDNYYPYSVAISPDGTFAYVSNTNRDSVSRIDLSSNTVVGAIDVGDFPMGVGFNSDGSKAYVANAGAGTVTEIGTATDSVLRTITMPGRDVRALAVTPDRVLTAEYTTDDLYAVDPTSSQIFESALGISAYGPNSISLPSDGSFAYVVNRTGYLSRLEAPTATTVTGAVGGDKAITVSFDPADGKGLDVSYQYSLDAGATWNSPDPAVTGSPMTITGLQASTTYQVKVRAATAFANGAASSAVSAKTDPAPAPDPDPTPTPTPTPTPAPTPVTKKVQKAADGKGQPPARIKVRGVTVVTGRNALTNAGQSIRTQVVASLPDATAQGEVRYVKVIRGSQGLVKVRTYGRPDLKIVVRQYAPATSEYKAFSTRSVYVGGVKR